MTEKTEHWTVEQFRAYQRDQRLGVLPPSPSVRELTRRRTKSTSPTETAVDQATVEPAPKSRPVQHEYAEQVRFFHLVELLREVHPQRADELLDVYATSSGGFRAWGTAVRMRLAGQRAGILDIECMVPSQGFHALFIELKPLGRGRPTPEQSARVERLSMRGYKALIVHGWVNAARILCDYLGLPFPEQAERMVEVRIALERVTRKHRKRKVKAKKLAA